ncbi:MAG: hypothetical protein K6A65_05395 [Succinivibrionaceae bacterium]|nr:hypothetical protein [Succinivibrionaceae bacterium]
MAHNNDSDNKKIKNIFGDFIDNILGGEGGHASVRRDQRKTEPGWDGPKGKPAPQATAFEQVGGEDGAGPETASLSKADDLPVEQAAQGNVIRSSPATLISTTTPEELLAPLTREENQLFHDWETRRRYRGFMRDGAVNPDLFASIHKMPRLIVVLREAPADSGNDLRAILSSAQGDELRSWERTARLAGIFLGNIGANPGLSDISRLLQEIVVMHLKKTPRGYASYDTEINDFVHNNQPFIWKQLRLYRADIVLACGRDVCEMLHDEIFEEAGGWKSDSPTDTRYFWTRRASEDRKTLVVGVDDPFCPTDPEHGDGNSNHTLERVSAFWTNLMGRIASGGEEQ